MNQDDELTTFGSEPIRAIHLTRSPLVRVLAQIRWAPMTSFDLENTVSTFAPLIGSTYPLRETQQEVSFLVTPDGVKQQDGGRIHQFVSADDAWKVSVADGHISLETSAYLSRDDFTERLSAILDAWKQCVTIPRVVRIGYRYTNRIDRPEDYALLSELVTPLVLGGINVPTDDSVTFLQSTGESAFGIESGMLVARWAQLAPNSTVDPTLPPSENKSWVLDIDAFREARLPFDTEAIVAEARRLAQSAYRFMRAVTTDRFTTHFGGETNADS